MGPSAPLQPGDHCGRMIDQKWSTSDQKSAERTRIIWCIYVIGFMDMFGVSMVIPLFGHHVRSLGASPTAAGILASVYGVLQLFSSTIIGSWSDVVGRRYSLLTCLLVSAMGYFLLGMSTSIALFVLARIPVGLFKHSLSICRALLSDLVTGSERAVVMGYFSTASSLGFILGPVVSGYLSEHEGGFYTSSFTCASIFILNAGLVWMLPRPKTLPHSNGTSSNNGFQEVCCDTNCSKTVSNGSANGSCHCLEAEKRASLLRPALKKVSSIGTNIRTVICSDLWDLFLVRLLMAIAILLFHSNFSQALGERFSMRPKDAGYLISYSNTLGALSGFVVGPVIRLYRNNISALLLHSTVLTCSLIFLYASAVSVWHVLISSTFISISITVGRMCITHLELQRGGGGASGTLIGAEQSVTAVGRVLAHVLSGLSQEFSPCGPPTVGVVMSLTAVFVLLIRIPKWNKMGVTKMD